MPKRQPANTALATARLKLKPRLSQQKLADLVGTTQSTITKLERGEIDMSRTWAERLAPILGVTAEFLIFGTPSPQPSTPNIVEFARSSVVKTIDPASTRAVKLVPVRGLVGAGWMDFATEPIEVSGNVSAVAGDYARFEQVAYKVVGNSMDARRIFDGDYVICIPPWAGVGSGELVVIERQRGQLVERTVKELVITPTEYQFWPRSTDARHQKPFVTPRPATDPPTLHEDDETVITIVGKVIYRGGFVGR